MISDKLLRLSGVYKNLDEIGLGQYCRSVSIVNKYHPQQPLPRFITIDLEEGGYGHIDIWSIFKGYAIINGKRA